jgi:hypothetical protein
MMMGQRRGITTAFFYKELFQNPTGFHPIGFFVFAIYADLRR